MRGILKYLIFAPFLLFLNGCQTAPDYRYSSSKIVLRPLWMRKKIQENSANFANKYNGKIVMTHGFIDRFNGEKSFRLKTFWNSFIGLDSLELPVCQIDSRNKKYLFNLKKGDYVVAMGEFYLSPGSIIENVTLTNCIFAKSKRNRKDPDFLSPVYMKYFYSDDRHQPWCDLSEDPIYKNYRNKFTSNCNEEGYFLDSQGLTFDEAEQAEKQKYKNNDEKLIDQYFN